MEKVKVYKTRPIETCDHVVAYGEWNQTGEMEHAVIFSMKDTVLFTENFGDGAWKHVEQFKYCPRCGKELIWEC